MAPWVPGGWDAVVVRLGALVVIAGWFAGWFLLARLPMLSLPSGTRDAGGARSAVGPGTVTDVSVVIPARNEAQSLPHLLGSLAIQDVQPAQVVVVDDGSDDGTADVARDFGATVMTSAPLPEGWTGKSWACMQGADAAVGSTLVFLDADVRVLPGGFGAVIDEHARRGGLVSVQPYHRMERPYERLSAVFNAIAVMGVGAATPRRHARADGAFGPCMVCDVDDYRSVGGHGAVRSDVLEDMAMGQVFAAAGKPVHGLGGRGALEFRMYPDGLGQLVEGWSKNMASGSASISVVRMLATVLWVCAAVSASSEVVQWLIGTSSASTADVWLGWFVMAVQFGVMLRQLGNFGWWPVVAFPVPLVAFIVVFFDSLWLTVVRRRVRWRGRTVPLPPRHTGSRRIRGT